MPQGDGKLLSRQQVQRTRARVVQATDLLWNGNIVRVIEQLTELSDDLLAELDEFDSSLDDSSR